MAILKLPNEGDTHTGRIAGCVEVAGNFGPQVKFTFESGDDLYLAQKSADGQLSRIPLTYEECVGEVLTFSRDHNAKMPDKPYWSIKLATSADKAPPSKRLSYKEAATPVGAAPINLPIAGAELAQEKARVARAYLDLFGYVKSQAEMQGVSDVAVQAATATIWIAWNQQGLTRAEPKAQPPKPVAKPVLAPAPHDFSDFPPEPETDESLPF
jgi:hypothetical protein